jgi:hypothetical protein
VSLTFKAPKWARATSSSSSLGSMLTNVDESVRNVYNSFQSERLPTVHQEDRSSGWSRARSVQALGSRTSTTTSKNKLGAIFCSERTTTDHDERRVAGSAAQVDEPALGEEDDVTTGGKGETVNLGLDVYGLDRVLLDPRDIDLDVEVTDAAPNVQRMDHQ